MNCWKVGDAIMCGSRRYVTKHAAVRAFQHAALNSHTQKEALRIWGELVPLLSADQQKTLRRVWMQHTCGAGSEALEAECNRLAQRFSDAAASGA